MDDIRNVCRIHIGQSRNRAGCVSPIQEHDRLTVRIGSVGIAWAAESTKSLNDGSIAGPKLNAQRVNRGCLTDTVLNCRSHIVQPCWPRSCRLVAMRYECYAAE